MSQLDKKEVLKIKKAVLEDILEKHETRLGSSSPYGENLLDYIKDLKEEIEKEQEHYLMVIHHPNRFKETINYIESKIKDSNRVYMNIMLDEEEHNKKEKVFRLQGNIEALEKILKFIFEGKK